MVVMFWPKTTSSRSQLKKSAIAAACRGDHLVAAPAGQKRATRYSRWRSAGNLGWHASLARHLGTRGTVEECGELAVHLLLQRRKLRAHPGNIECFHRAAMKPGVLMTACAHERVCTAVQFLTETLRRASMTKSIPHSCRDGAGYQLRAVLHIEVPMSEVFPVTERTRVVREPHRGSMTAKPFTGFWTKRSCATWVSRWMDSLT